MSINQNSKFCLNKKTTLILAMVIGASIFAFFISYSLSYMPSQTFYSKATYKPQNNFFLSFTAMGLGNYISEVAFVSKYNSLTKLIDENPGDVTLKEAFSAFINGNIAIAGAYLQGSRLASDNMRHYIYGDGKDIDISNAYKKIGIDNYGSMGEFMTFEISFGLNNKKSLTTFSAVDVSDIGFTSKTAKKILWNDLDVLVDSQTAGLENALGRHTLSSSYEVITAGGIVSDQVATQHVPLMYFLLSDLKATNTAYHIEQITVKPRVGINLYDRYAFNKERSGAGAYAEFSQLKYVMDIISKTVGFGELSIYMDKKSFEELKNGAISLPATGLKKLEDLKIASSYSINGNFLTKDVGVFSIYLIIRE